MRCVDIMSRELVTVEFGTPLEQAWALLLRERRIKALPVVDRTFRIAGIITLADFMRAAELDGYEGFAGKLRQLVRTTASVYSDKPEVVGQIMTRNVRVAGMQRHLVELLPLFGSTGHHHIPIIGEGERLNGHDYPVRPGRCARKGCRPWRISPGASRPQRRPCQARRAFRAWPRLPGNARPASVPRWSIRLRRSNASERLGRHRWSPLGRLGARVPALQALASCASVGSGPSTHGADQPILKKIAKSKLGQNGLPSP